MKAPSSDASKGDGADDDGPNEFDYSDFFSVLMYYGHMTKNDIMNSSRPFLHGIYRMYAKRACENLGVSPKNEEETDADHDENGYPKEFQKLVPRHWKEAGLEFTSTKDFLSQFSMAAKYKDGLTIEKEVE